MLYVAQHCHEPTPNDQLVLGDASYSLFTNDESIFMYESYIIIILIDLNDKID